MRVRLHVIIWVALLMVIGNDLLLKRANMKALTIPMASSLESIQYLFSSSASPCKVLIESGHNVALLESLIAQFNFADYDAEDPIKSCNRSSIEVSVKFAMNGVDSRWEDWIISWKSYANRDLVKRTFPSPDGSIRRLVPSGGLDMYHLHIRSNCSCTKDDVAWVYASPSHRGVFERDCDMISNRAISLHPSSKPNIFPIHFPIIRYPEPPNKTTFQLCTVQQDASRFIANFLFTHPHLTPATIQFIDLAAPDGTNSLNMRQFAGRYRLVPQTSMDYMEYCRFVYETCDAIVSVANKTSPTTDQWDTIKGLAIASAYKKPLLLHQDVDQLYQEYLQPSTRTTHGGDFESFATGMNRVLSQIDKPESPSDSSWRPPCQVLLDNHHQAYHYFLLESMVAQYPLPALDSCDHSRLEFTIVIMKGINIFQRQRGKSWITYAEKHILNKEYGENEQVRVVEAILRTKATVLEPFHYVINTTCRCDNTSSWLLESSNGYCVFHEKCPQFADSVQASWLSPMHKRFFFPNLLPTFDHERNSTKAVNLCVIGHPLRRHYALFSKYVTARPTLTNSSLRVHNLGWGKVPPVLQPHLHFVTFHAVAGYEEYQRLLYDTCDGILGLMTKDSHPYYFADDLEKLTGIVCHASAYKTPILIHEELATLYRPYLGDVVETHTNEQKSFDQGLDKFLNILRASKGV
jgi:hypothetical protein